MTKLEKAAYTVVHRCMDIKKDEFILIMADEPLMDIARLLYQASLKQAKHIFLLQLSTSSLQGELDDSVAQFMQKMNAVMAVTSRSISHTNARREACRMGTRIVSMPNITSSTFTRLATTEFKKVARLSKKMSDILTIGKDVRVTAPNGTELEISIENGRGYADTGTLNFPGAFSNLPAGEACILPDTGKTEGVLIVDSGMGVDKKDADRLVLTIRNGRVTRISGSLAAQKLRRQLAKYGAESRTVAEFGIGTNRNALISGYSLEDEKVLGTIHIAVGNNVSFGGDVKIPIHLDGVVYKASVDIDGRKILQRGRLLLD